MPSPAPPWHEHDNHSSCGLSQKRSAIVKLSHTTGELSLTPDHVLLVDGEWTAARTVKVGSSLSGSTVTAVSHAGVTV